MTNLVKFLRARLNEDEAAAKSATPGPWRVVNVTDYRSATVDGADALQDGGYDEATKTRKQEMRPRTVIPPDADYGPTVGLEDAEHIARHDPVRVLAEVEVKRRIVDEHGPNEYGLCDVCVLNDDARRAPCPTLRLLTLPYADHPDYRGEWRPD